jgi:cholesterol oxidase
MSPGAAMDHDAIVVGTGYGGAATAAVLARAGLRVGVLERGTWWGSAVGKRPLPETLPQLVRALEGLNVSLSGRSVRLPVSHRGLFEVHVHGRTLLMNALAVGGTSLVNGALMQRPAASFFRALPPELTADELEPHYQAVERALSVAPGPVDEGARRRLAVLADDAKWTLRRAPQAIRWEAGGGAADACSHCNRCIVGCNLGAKQSLDLNLIPGALTAGAELRDLCAVRSVHPIDGGYEVRFRDLRTRATKAWRARRVVLAAGTLNTHKILFQSREVGALPAISDQLGCHASLGADVLSWYRAPDAQIPRTVDGHGSDLVLEVPGADGDRELTVGMLTPPQMPGSWLLRRLQGRHTLSLIGFGLDAMDGRVVWTGRGVELRHRRQAVIGRIHAAMDRIAGAYGWDKPGRMHDPQRPGRSWMSVHPMGGCRMAPDAGGGVVDFRGEVFGHPGLHVADASVIASAPAAGPALSIAALAWWISQRIVDEDGRAGA